MIITVQIPASESFTYPIIIEAGLLQFPASWMPAETRKVVIVTDETVKSLYGNKLLEKLQSLGYQTSLFSFAPGEKSKNIETVCTIQESMFQAGCDRNTLLLCLGGGVTGDMAGFIAATYMRGISCIQIPTTLLGMVDSSTGGKTGIDTQSGKNLMGAYWHPEKLIIDMDTLDTLPKLHHDNGLFEILKIFLLLDNESLSAIQNTNTSELIHRAVSLKADIVMQDARETGKRAILNFGHTIGHALEKYTDYAMLHGFAVAYGILVETKIANLLGYLSDSDWKAIASLLKKYDIDAKDLHQIDVDAVIGYTKNDKKNRNGAVHYVLLEKPGAVLEEEGQWTHPVTDEVVRQAWTSIVMSGK